MIGRTLGRYEILEPLGKGGMGEVYLARDSRLGRRVALKLLPAELTSDPEYLQRFEREARTIASLKHPNVVTLYSIEEAGEIRFLTMELIEGSTLRTRLVPDGLPLHELLAVAIPLASALEAAHGEGIIHRDLKPENVMIDRGGEVKLLDFGLARPLEPGAGPSPEQKLTQRGTVLGTFRYMSPEQTVGDTLDERSDLFSLGVVLYEMAAGEAPFQGRDRASLIRSILKHSPPPLSERRPDLPHALSDLVAHCLAKRPARRIRSSRELRERLEALRTSAAPTETLTPTPARQASRSRWVALGVALAAILLAAVTWKMTRSQTPNSVTDGVPAIEALTSEPAPVAARSRIAVLPFVNLGSADREYLAAGLTEELTSLLADLEGLEVIARTSAAAWARSGQSVSRIGEAMNLEYVIEGSVRWGEELVRVQPRLIRALDDTRLWAEPFERPAANLFELPTAMAREITAQIAGVIVERPRGLDLPTQSAEAYDAYLRGEHALQSIEGDLQPASDAPLAHLRRATELDPGFLAAWTELARAALVLGDETLAREAAERAIFLAPAAPRTVVAAAAFEAQVERDFSSALDRLEGLPESWRKDSDVLQLEAQVLEGLGRREEARERLERAYSVNPLDDRLRERILDLGGDPDATAE